MTEATILRKYTLGEQILETETLIRYRGKSIQKGEPVICTVIKPEIVPAGEFLARYEIIARALARLESPTLVQVLDRGEYKRQAVLVQESVEGKPLAGLIAGGNGLPVDEVLDIASQLGEFLDALHRQGVFQGIFDPQNILLAGQDSLRVYDTGLAQGLNIGELLLAGKVKANPYHAPELLRGRQGDARTDFYSLGALLFAALTGRESDAQAAAGKTPTLADLYPSRLRPGLPPELDELVAKCLHPDPARRIQSAAEFLDGVDEVRRGMAVGAGQTMLSIEDSLVGQTLGAYRLVERLGQGGMATVYKAYEPSLGRYVAIKVLPQFLARDPSFLRRFRREAKAVAQLSHPNIVPIHSYGEDGDVIFIVMQYVEGGTLKHGRERVFRAEEALRLLLPITRALGYAHARGIVHRDIKPSNVLLGEGSWPLLADFGLAQMAEASVKLTGTGIGVGTPAYMSPEQGQGDKVDARTDIYSLGIMLYELVTGDVPFKADTPMAIVIKHLTAPMPLPRQVKGDIPQEVEEIILKATAKNPAARYQSAEEMAAALEAALEDVIFAKKAKVVIEEKTQPAPEAAARKVEEVVEKPQPAPVRKVEEVVEKPQPAPESVAPAREAEAIVEKPQPVAESVAPAKKAEVIAGKPPAVPPAVAAKPPAKKKGNLKLILILLFSVMALCVVCSILVGILTQPSAPTPMETPPEATATFYSTSAPVIVATSYQTPMLILKATSVPMIPTATPVGSTYCDEFDDLNSGWPVFGDRTSSEAGYGEVGYGEGAYQIAFYQPSPGYFHVAWSPEQYDDFTAEVAISVPEGSGAGGGLTLRMGDLKWYLIWIYPDSAEYTFSYVTSDEFTSLIPPTVSEAIQPLQQDGRLHLLLKVIANRDTFDIWVGNPDEGYMHLDTITDVTQRFGYLGPSAPNMVTSGGAPQDILFDWICITPANPQSTAKADAVLSLIKGQKWPQVLAEAGKWSLALFDTFDSDTGVWTTGPYDGTLVSGDREILDGKYRWELTAKDGFSFRSTANLDPVTDFYLSTDVRVVSGPEGAGAGVIFRLMDGSNYYRFNIDGSQHYTILMRENGNWQTLIS